MTKHAHRVSNLANEDVNLVGILDQTWSDFYGSVTLIVSNLRVKAATLLVKH